MTVMYSKLVGSSEAAMRLKKLISMVGPSNYAAIVQGLIALMLKVFSEKKPQEILDTDISFLKQIGLDEHLSPTRKNGLSSLVSSIKNAAKIKLV